MTSVPPALNVVTYHYVRNTHTGRFTRLHAMQPADFRVQVDRLRERYEMATLESAMAFLAGSYTPARDLCLLTFDDGLREHYEVVYPYLVDRGIQGVFFLITSCLDGEIAPVHLNHFLMAELGFDDYQGRFHARLAARGPSPAADPVRARVTYRWDSIELATFKYLLNFQLEHELRTSVLQELFVECFGDPARFSPTLYLTWSEGAVMHQDGMMIGGHTHTHPVLARLAAGEQETELTTSTVALRQRFDQPLWAFSYPFGQPHAYTEATVALVRTLGFCCAFTTSPPGNNRAYAEPFSLRRIDPKECPV